MAKLLTPPPIIIAIQSTDKATCTSILQAIFSAIRVEHT